MIPEGAASGLAAPSACQQDKVETALCAEVCAGAITLQQVRDEIKADRYSVLLLLQP